MSNEHHQLPASFTGDVIAPDDFTYDDARRVWNTVFADRRPALIVRPASVSDVATAIRFGRDAELEIAIRSGAHSNSGHSTTDGGLVIDMSRLRGVIVDPERRTARVLGGSLLGELDAAAQAHGLVCPVGVVGHTGVAGLTLGAGIGRLQRHFGLTIDNVRAVELVTADGRSVRASATEEPELFWGMRGAGPNFGVATAFEFDLHPFGPELNRGSWIYRAADADAVWAMVRAYAATAPDAVSLTMAIGRAEPAADYPPAVAGEPIVIVAYNHSGAAADVNRDVAPLRGGPAPVGQTHGSAPYLEVQTAHDLAMGWGHRSMIESAYANDLAAGTLDALVAHVADAPTGASFSVTVEGGAIGRLPDDAMAYTGRDARFDVSADADWEDAALDSLYRGWVQRAMAIVQPDLTVGRYLNGMCEVGPDRTREIYGDGKLPRLRALKRTWDPDNVFRLNHNIAP
jgi:FAD/FMN-containing dehydrogenase